MDAQTSQPAALTPEPEEPPVRREDLARVFTEAEVPRSQFRIGAEEEKFGYLVPERTPLPYEGDRSVRRILSRLASEHGWQEKTEQPGGPVIGLQRGDLSVTLEPGGQLELSGAPCSDLHGVRAEKCAHLAELLPISNELGVSWHAVGFHPLARQADLPWVPKTRYPIMKSYLPTRGDGAWDMMRRTATVQANYDFSSERDAMRKLVVGLKLSPFIHALLANSPFIEGEIGPQRSMRGSVWLRMDPSRSGLVPSLWSRPEPSYDDYVEWSLDAGMFLFWRDGKPITNTGQTFRDFLEHGYAGHRATLTDYRLHLSTLFPEVRLKSTLEVRPLDALPVDLSIAGLALFTGILYGERALAEAEALSSDWDHQTVDLARHQLTTEGLAAPVLRGRAAWTLGEKLVELARLGLLERGLGEEQYLEPLGRLLEARQCPADRLLERAARGEDLLTITRLDLPGAASNERAPLAVG